MVTGCWYGYPKLTTLPPYSYLIVPLSYANDIPTLDRYHINFLLENYFNK